MALPIYFKSEGFVGFNFNLIVLVNHVCFNVSKTKVFNTLLSIPG